MFNMLYASFTATLIANIITDYESEYDFIRQELMHVATTSTFPWAVQLRNLCDTISNMGWFSESDLAVLTNTLKHDMSDCAGPDVELVASQVDNAAASAAHLTWLPLPAPDALTHSGHSVGHFVYCLCPTGLDLLAFCRPSTPDNILVISDTGRGALAIFFASHELSFKAPSDFYTNDGSAPCVGPYDICASLVRKCQ
jgi:hypothetical protein